MRKQVMYKTPPLLTGIDKAKPYDYTQELATMGDLDDLERRTAHGRTYKALCIVGLVIAAELAIMIKLLLF